MENGIKKAENSGASVRNLIVYSCFLLVGLWLSNVFSVNRINRIQIKLADCYVSNDLVGSLNPFVKCVLIVGR